MAVPTLNPVTPKPPFSTNPGYVPPRTNTPPATQPLSRDQAVFGCTKTQPQFACARTTQPKFGGLGRKIATGTLGLGTLISAVACWTAAAGLALLGCVPFMHFLWPIAGIIATIPVAVGGLTMLVGSGGKSEEKEKKD